MGRCTTEMVWGNSILIHWTNYLWEWVRGISQHPLSLLFLLFCASLQITVRGKIKIINMQGIVLVWKDVEICLKNETYFSEMPVYSEIQKK